MLAVKCYASYQFIQLQLCSLIEVIEATLMNVGQSFSLRNRLIAMLRILANIREQ